MSDSLCPDCKGSRSMMALVMYSGQCRYKRVDCHTCGATGCVDDAFLERRAAGKVMRDERVARRESLGEASRRMGITAAALSEIERGRVAPDAPREEVKP